MTSNNDNGNGSNGNQEPGKRSNDSNCDGDKNKGFSRTDDTAKRVGKDVD